jgi:hypothetical protein
MNRCKDKKRIEISKMNPNDTAPTDPYVYPTRYWDCIDRVDSTLQTMSEEELVGAYKIMKKVSDFFWIQHFEKYAMLNQRGVVKTLDDISENICLELQHRVKVEESYRKISGHDTSSCGGGGGPRHYFPT